MESPPSPHRSRRQRLRRWFALALPLAIALGGWLGWRVYDRARHDASQGVGWTGDYWSFYYRSLARSGVLEARAEAGDGRLDVILLGGSVLETASGPLERTLEASGGRVYPMAVSAHTTRDSFNKFSRVCEEGRAADVLLVYHGINDARMNCVPPGEFAADYSHLGYYAGFERSRASGTLVPPVRLEGFFGGAPAELAHYGELLRSPETFRANLEGVIRLARERGSWVVLATFLAHLPDPEALTLWGRGGDVRRAVDAHNQILRELAEAHPHVLLLDVEHEWPLEPEAFTDPCHLTPEANASFAALLADWLEARRTTLDQPPR